MRDEPDELHELAAGVKAEVRAVLDELDEQNTQAELDRRSRARRFWLGGAGLLLATLFIAGLVAWTELTARSRFADLREQQRATFCPLIEPLTIEPSGPLTDEQREYRDRARRAYTALGCAATAADTDPAPSPG